MSDKLLVLGTATVLDIPPKTVVRLVGQNKDKEVGLKLNIGQGAGVHLLASAKATHSSYEVDIAADAQFTFSLPGLLSGDTTWQLKFKLTGEGAKANVELAILAPFTSQARFDVLLEHQAPHTTGRINSRRVQLANSMSEFVGTLYVGVNAQGTDTYLSDKTLLLGEQSKAKSDPRLEILADEVRASHGATIGRLSQEEVFYLRSRGLPEQLAEVILVQSFLKPALVGVPLEIQDKFIHDISIR